MTRWCAIKCSQRECNTHTTQWLLIFADALQSVTPHISSDPVLLETYFQWMQGNFMQALCSAWRTVKEIPHLLNIKHTLPPTAQKKIKVKKWHAHGTCVTSPLSCFGMYNIWVNIAGTFTLYSKSGKEVCVLQLRFPRCQVIYPLQAKPYHLQRGPHSECPAGRNCPHRLDDYRLLLVLKNFELGFLVQVTWHIFSICLWKAVCGQGSWLPKIQRENRNTIRPKKIFE